MTEPTEKRLTTTEVLKEAYKILQKNFSANEVVFSKPVGRTVEIGWDPCRGTESETFGFENAAVLQRGKSSFLIACGESRDNTELIAILLHNSDHKNPKHLGEIIHDCSDVSVRSGVPGHSIKSLISAIGHNGEIQIDNNERSFEILRCESRARDVVLGVLSREFKLPPEFIQVEMKIKLGSEKKRDNIGALTYDSKASMVIAKYFEFRLFGYITGYKDPD